MSLRASLLPAASLATLSLLVGCGSSPPTRYYTLSEVTTGKDRTHQPVSLSPNIPPVPIRLEPVSIPAELDRPELVLHRDPNRVLLADSDRWAAPLDEQIRRTLSDDLTARLPPNWVADPNESATRAARHRLSVSIAHFDATANCAVHLQASWVLHLAAGDQSGGGDASGSEQVDVPGGSACPGGLPAAMSQALGIFADRVAASIGPRP